MKYVKILFAMALVLTMCSAFSLKKDSTCMIYFSENRKKLEKEATKILSKYKRNRNTTVTRIDTDKFHFIKPEE